MNPAQILNKIRSQFCSWRDRIRAAAYLNKRELIKINLKNRATLSRVPMWISDEVRRNSVFQYGIPDSILHLIDDDIGDGITYTDALVVVSKKLKKQISYLEIGVSVGKNFLQIIDRLESAQLTGFDIEEINPVLDSKLNMISTRTWPTKKGSLKKKDSSFTTYTVSESTNTVRYLSGDVFDTASWAQLYGEKFNLVFSDAFHSAEAMFCEYDMLTKFHLLDSGDIVMMWDDLGGEMTLAFEQICQRLKQMRPDLGATSFIVPLNGWLGVNEAKHLIGFFIRSHE